MAIGTTLKIAFDGNQVKRGLSDMKSGMKSLAKSAAIGAAAVTAIGAGLVFAAKKAIDAGLAINRMGELANTAEKRVEAIAKQIGIFGDQSGVVAERLNDLSDSTARMIGVDQKSIKATIAKMITFKGLAASADTVGGAFDRATMAALDMAAAGFGTAESNAVQLGKALEDPISGLSALRRSGITFTQAEKEKIKTLVESNRVLEAQGLILDAIEGQLGGAAVATADASQRIAVGIQQMRESFAMGFAGSFGTAADALEPFFASAMEPLKNFGQRIGDAIKNAMSGNESDLVNIGFTIGGLIKSGITTGMKISGKEITASIFGKIQDLDNWIVKNIGIGFEQNYGDVIESQISKENKAALSQVISQGRETLSNLTNPANNPNRVIMNGNAYQPIPGGMQGADLWKDGQAYRLLERIANNTQPSPL
jgi:hypothetical protein